jgi:hypothetical protein
MDTRKSYKIVYTIVQRPRDGRKFWLRIGAAFVNADGSWNVYLDALPTNGQLQIRDAKALDRELPADADADAA